MTTETGIEVELVQALPGVARRLRLALPAGATVAQALQRAAESGFEPAAGVDAGCLAVFGRPATLSTLLRAGDRLELLRPLLADPKQRRRERAGARKP